jgi:hypothetical protein
VRPVRHRVRTVPPINFGGQWTESVLYEFCQTGGNRCSDGARPFSKLVFDGSGNLYGTTSLSDAGGVVFELSPGVAGWTETVLYSFCSLGAPPVCPDGNKPMAGVVFDKEGNLYRTTSAGGSPKYQGGGVIYKLTPGQNGWTEKTVYAFPGATGPKGGGLFGEVNFDSAGNIYSTAAQGGANGWGVVFRLTPKGCKKYRVSLMSTALFQLLVC